MFNSFVLYVKTLIWIFILVTFPDKGVHGEVEILAPQIVGVGIFCKIKRGPVVFDVR